MSRPDSDVLIPTDRDDTEPASPADIARIEDLMSSDLPPLSGRIEPDDDPSMAEHVHLSQAVTFPASLDPREPEAVVERAPASPCGCRSWLRTPEASASMARGGHHPRCTVGGPTGFSLDDGAAASAVDLSGLARRAGYELIDAGAAVINVTTLPTSPDDLLHVSGVLGQRAAELGRLVVRLGVLSRAYGRLAAGEGLKGA